MGSNNDGASLSESGLVAGIVNATGDCGGVIGSVFSFNGGPTTTLSELYSTSQVTVCSNSSSGGLVGSVLLQNGNLAGSGNISICNVYSRANVSGEKAGGLSGSVYALNFHK